MYQIKQLSRAIEPKTKSLHVGKKNMNRKMKIYCTDLELFTSTTTISLLAPVIKLWKARREKIRRGKVEGR